MDTVKVVVDINEGIADARVESCPPGVRVEVAIRDYDTEGTDFTGMTKGEDYETETTEGGQKIRYLIGNGTVHDEPLANEPERIYCGWTIEDAKTVCPSLTDDEAREVMEETQHRFDAEVGMSWDNIRNAVAELFPEYETENNG
jgi:hypothetical protein